MKTVSIVVPTYNEEENVRPVYTRIRKIFEEQLITYQYEILYIDNRSTDRTREQIWEICKTDRNVRAIFNAGNFGFDRSVFYGLLQGSGDCTALIFADMQDPPELLARFVREWENGSRIVIGIKSVSRENPGMYCIRKLYYRFIHKIADISHIDQFDGFGLYDKTFIEILQQLDDPLPYFRGIVAELGSDRTEIPYIQEKRRAGQSAFSLMKYYDTAMLGITSYSKIMIRLAAICGFIMSVVSFLTGLITLLVKLLNWEYFQTGTAAILTGVFFLGSVLLFFLGIQGEYILAVNIRVMRRPMVVEEARINFDKKASEE